MDHHESQSAYYRSHDCLGPDQLTYIALGNEVCTDVVLYPDSGKYGAWHGDSGDAEGPGNFKAFARKETAVYFWAGETDS